MNAKPIRVFYDINRMEPVDLISTIHIDDKNTRYLELTLLDHRSLLVLQGCTVKARFVATDKTLLSDNVPCTVTADNTILVPIDAAAVQSMACDLRIEINIVSGTDVLTLPFPLWVRVRGSILGNAHVSPDSEGTVPELLKEVEEELKRVQGFITDDDVYEIMDGAFQGNSTVSPQFLIDSTVDQQHNPFGHLMVYYVDSNDVRHNLYDFYTTFVNMLKYRVVNSPDDATQIGVLYRTEISVDHDSQTVYVWCYENLSQFTQFAYLMNGHIAWRTKDKQTAWQPESDWGAWREIGGSGIASGVVNQNGTITFFDENGDPLFATTGESVIGADGYSPTVSTTNLDAQTLVTVTDTNGAHNFYVKDGSSVTNAAVDENGDLIISIQQKPTSSVHPTIHTLDVNAGHVVGAAGAKGDKGDKGDPGNDYVLTEQDKADIAGEVVQEIAEEVGDLKSAIDLMTEWKYKSFCPLTFHQGRLDTSNRPVTINTTNTYFVYTDYVDISAVPLNDKLYFVAPSGINVLGFMASSSDNNPANSAVTGWKNGTVCEWTKTSNAFKYFAISAYISYSATFTPEQAASSGIGVYQIAESVDDALSANSENPVQNKIVYAAIENTKEILMTSQIPVSYTLNRNKYINFNSGKVISTSSNYAYTTPIHAEQGDVVFLPQVNDSAVIAKLSEVVIENESYRGLANIGTTEGRAFYFVIPRECDVVFCAPEGRLGEFKLFHGIAIKSILDAAYGKTSNGIIDLEKTANTMHPSGGQILYKGDTAVNSGHLVNALAYDNGVIIGARSDGKIVRIGYDGTEETLLSLNGSNMDWRCLFKDSSGNVYASPHATFGSLQMTDRGLYRLSGTTLAWVDLEHPSWETGAIRSAPVGNAIRFNPDASAFRHTFAQVTTGDTVRIRVYTTASTVNIYGAFTDDNNIVISSPTEYFPTDQVAAFRDLPSLTVPTGATRLHIMTYTQSGWESECRIQAYQTIPPASSFVKVISLYDPSSSIQTETEENNDTIWTMCEDDTGNLYAGAYAHTTHANPAIYKSTDGGLTWNYLFNFNSAGLTSNGRHIHSIVYSKWQKALYCIVGEVNTIFKSVDGGESWVNLNVVLNVKGTVMLPTPSGIIIGSDGAYNLFIDVLKNDDTTHYNVFTGWANTVFALRLSDLTGFFYAFTKIDSAVNNVNYYPPISALTDPSAITTWQNSVPAATFDAWSNYRNSVLSEYPDDAIRPQHYAILVSRNGGNTWEVLRRWKCPSNGAYGFITTGQFLNGECITGLYNELGFVNPIIISEGKHKYISGGCDLDGEIFVRTNASSTVTVL